MSDCGFNIALLRNVVKLVETQLNMSQYFFLTCLRPFLDCSVIRFFFLYPFQVLQARKTLVGY